LRPWHWGSELEGLLGRELLRSAKFAAAAEKENADPQTRIGPVCSFGSLQMSPVALLPSCPAVPIMPRCSYQKQGSGSRERLLRQDCEFRIGRRWIYSGGRIILCFLTVCGVAGRVATSAGGPPWKIAIPSTPPPHHEIEVLWSGVAWQGKLSTRRRKMLRPVLRVAARFARTPRGRPGALVGRNRCENGAETSRTAKAMACSEQHE
jgi:hypothetical protein